MFRRPCSVVLPCLLTLAGCARQSTPDVEGARAALRETASQYAKAIAAKNKEAFMAFYASDAAAHPPGAESISGLPAVSAFIDPLFKDAAFVGSFQPATVDVSADGTMGTTMAIADITATGPDGKPTTEHVRDFHVWRRQPDGSWKLTVDIWNAAPQPAASPVKD